MPLLTTIIHLFVKQEHKIFAALPSITCEYIKSFKIYYQILFFSFSYKKHILFYGLKKHHCLLLRVFTTSSFFLVKTYDWLIHGHRQKIVVVKTLYHLLPLLLLLFMFYMVEIDKACYTFMFWKSRWHPETARGLCYVVTIKQCSQRKSV